MFRLAIGQVAKATLKVENLDAVADRGYFNSEEILRQALGHAAEADDLELEGGRARRQAGLPLHSPRGCLHLSRR
jgi:hypothetical protein